MSYSHLWDRLREQDPDHSVRYAQRWRDLAAQGHDLDGEARFVDAMAPRGSRILDAGCGTGRVGGYLAAAGHDVVGVDLDDYLIADARETYPSADWHVGDLARFDFSTVGAGFDIIVSAGNVMTFLDPHSRHRVMANLAGALAADGRLVSGFGAGRGYEFADYEADLRAAGLQPAISFSTWNLHPFTPGSGFLVCVAQRAGAQQEER
ncbi:class I SAM-dependent methyltransferase [Brevibacterium daeguense]|uniref:Class I SAM-dependent methyltransferase n=1 Tax=Brevibacterium daeguense TaxID=909936 RepID=A0ABP8EL30_9MICO|nr:class I SAM-dependent methyltransferase [Brevibacterium daeguense]